MAAQQFFGGPVDREDGIAKTSLSNNVSIRGLGRSLGRFVWLQKPFPCRDLQYITLFTFPINLYTWGVLTYRPHKRGMEQTNYTMHGDPKASIRQGNDSRSSNSAVFPVSMAFYVHV